MHGLLSVGAAGYLWYSGRAPATPHSSLYCYDRVASWFLCGHTGFLLHELIFYARYNKLLTPQFPMHMIHHVVFLLAIVMVEVRRMAQVGIPGSPPRSSVSSSCPPRPFRRWPP